MAVRPAARLIAFVRLGRPLFLVGGVVFHALGAAMALFQGHPLDVTALILGQTAITAAQLMTHYANDYFDLPNDLVNHNLTPWSGGSRVLPEGRLPPRVALIAARVLMGVSLAAILALALAARPNPLAIAALIAGLALAWCYSAPPIRLVERGLGELAAAVVVPGLTSLAGLLIQGGEISLTAGLVILPLACLQFAMLLAVEFPDAEADAATGKRNLVVRLGGQQAALLHTLMVVAAFLAMLIGLVVTGVRDGLSLAVWLLAIWLVTLPFGMWHGSRVALGAWCDPLQWGSVAFWGIALLVATAMLTAAVFTWSAVQRGAILPGFL